MHVFMLMASGHYYQSLPAYMKHVSMCPGLGRWTMAAIACLQASSRSVQTYSDDVVLHLQPLKYSDLCSLVFLVFRCFLTAPSVSVICCTVPQGEECAVQPADGVPADCKGPQQCLVPPRGGPHPLPLRGLRCIWPHGHGQGPLHTQIRACA